MRETPRFFPSDLDPRERRVYRWLTLFFCLVFVALSWPVYSLFGGIRPLILGMPLSLAYIVGVLVVSFLVLLGLYLWEDRRGTLDRDRGGPSGDAGRGSAGGGHPARRAPGRSRGGAPADGGSGRRGEA